MFAPALLATNEGAAPASDALNFQSTLTMHKFDDGYLHLRMR